MSYNNNRQFAMNLASCGFIDPQAQLSAALLNHDLIEFRNALDMGASATALDDNQMCIYEKALSTHGMADFVEECVRRGCNVNYINRHLEKAAINFAADSRDPQIVGVLLRRPNVQVNRQYANLTPLNSLAKNLNADNVQQVLSCIKLLLSYGASPNIPDQRQMTPLNYVLKNRTVDMARLRELVQLFLQQNDLDIDTYRQGEVRKLLMSQYADLRLPPVREVSDEVSIETLLRCLLSGKESQFLQQFAEHQLSLAEGDRPKAVPTEPYLPLFVEAIKHGMPEAFAALLQTGLDINAEHKKKAPIEIAIIWGNWRAVEQLLQQPNLKLSSHAKLLNSVIDKIDEPPVDNFCDYQKCFQLLLASDYVNVNETDDSGTTPLHYAVKYRKTDAIRDLLRHGAYIGMRSAFGDLPIEGMQPETLEEHFNNCISTNECKAGEQGFEILMDYKNLIRQQPHELEGSHAHAQSLHDEMTPLAYIAESKEFRHLLQHPLITSFLFLKWHRLSVVFYINFLLYVLFAISIITHTMLKFRESEYEAVTTLFGLFSWIGIAYLIVRELIQFGMSPVSYFRSITNYLELALILFSIVTCIESTYDRDTQRVIAVITILLVAVELCLLVGSLPVLSISTHMLMLRAVSSSFLKSFTLYSIFVITFSLCFFILFGKIETAPTGDVEDSEFNKFTNPLTALIKTIVMLTGEFDAGDIDFKSTYSYLIFLLFVFSMSIVLFNLLNGLAVSDTQAIKAQAELNGSICRANLLSRYETVLTGRSGRASFIVNHEPFRSICRRLMNLYPHYIAGRHIAIRPNDNNKVFIPMANAYEMQPIASHGNGVRHSKSNFLPLANGDCERQTKVLDPPVKFLTCCCSFLTGKCSEMDSRTVKLSLNVLDQKSNAKLNRQRQQATELRLQLIEQKLDQLLECLQKHS